MELVTGAFLKLLSMALTALPVMAVVLAARLFLRRAPKKYAYGLWAAVGVRLTCPVGLLRTAWSIFNLRPLERMSKYAANVETGFAAQPLPARLLFRRCLLPGALCRRGSFFCGPGRFSGWPASWRCCFGEQ